MQLKIPRVVKNWKYSSTLQPQTDNFRENGFGRRMSRTNNLPKHYYDAFSEFGLKPTTLEPVFQIFTGNHYRDGAYTHEHKDFAPQGFVHARCNVMLKKPDVGGNPILDDVEYEVGVNDMWLCLASVEMHSSVPIFGGERLIVSMGGLVPIEQILVII